MARSARALVVELVADTKDFVKGTQQADDALAKFAHSGSHGLDALERKAQQTSHDIAHGKTKEQFGEAGKEVGNEFATNLGSSLASGDLTAIAQDTAGGLVGAFAQMGGPFAVALAPLGVIATTVFAGIQKRAEQTAERISTVFDKMSSDAQAALSETERGEWFKTALTQLGGPGGLNKGIEKLRGLAKQAGVPLSEVASAIAHGGTELARVQARLQKVIAQNTEWKGRGEGARQSINQTAKDAKALLGFMGQVTTEIGKADANASALKETTAAFEKNTADAAANAAELNRQLRLAGRTPISPRNRRG